MNTRCLRILFVAATLVMAPLMTARAASLPDFASLVEQEHRAVVNISTSRKIRPQEGGLPPGFDIAEREELPLVELFPKFFVEHAEPRYR